MATTMKAVVFHGPHKVELEDRPLPTIQDPGDIIVKVGLSGLCGSELHVFRGHQPSPIGFIMGHEFTGVVSEVGSDVKTVKVGDKIVAPFTLSCLECFYCKNGATSRCVKGKLFGSAMLEGAQAEYIRVPLADGTVLKAPEDIKEEMLVLMADIFPTGYFAATNALKLLPPTLKPEDATFVLLGCGPVGLCALTALMSFNPKKVFAVDSVQSRLDLAKGLGAEPGNFMTNVEGLKQRVLDATDGRGADVVIEVVGNSKALRLGFELLRPWGGLSSVGVHNGEIPWTGNEAYGKNLKIQMGRCPVRALFPEALELLVKVQDKLAFMADKVMPLSDAVEGYRIFNAAQAQKVIFRC